MPSTELSFDLIDEPPKMKSYEGAFRIAVCKARTLVKAIGDEDPQRLIFADGINIGLAGEGGQYVEEARRHEHTWYLAAVTDQNARQLSMPLSFLSKGG